MRSFTIATLLFVLAVLFATPILGDYVERRAPEPARKKGGGGDDTTTTTESAAPYATSTKTKNFAPTNVANLAGVGAMAIAAGAAAMY